MFYTIYKITNLISGKFYIGKHKTDNLNDDYMGSGKRLKSSMNKYGEENFVKEILEVYDTEAKMNLAEKILVVIDSEVSYNLCPGGYGGWGYINSLNLDRKEAGRKGGAAFRKRMKEDPELRLFFREVLIKNRDKMNKSLRERYPEGTKSFLGKKHKSETLEKMRVAAKRNQLGKKNSQYGTMWITNGKENKKIKKEVDFIPEGWYKGRVLYMV